MAFERDLILLEHSDRLDDDARAPGRIHDGGLTTAKVAVEMYERTCLFRTLCFWHANEGKCARLGNEALNEHGFRSLKRLDSATEERKGMILGVC